MACPTIGCNQSWRLHWATYHVALELDHRRRDPEVYERLSLERRLFVVGKGWDLGIPIRNLDARWTPFSRDLALGVVTSMRGVGSVAYVALQLAVWMGFNPVLFVGLDLRGPKFTGEPTGNLEAMGALFQAARSALPEEIEVYNCAPDSACKAFPFRPLSACAASSAATAEQPRPASPSRSAGRR